jgi:hypothetical protein
MKKLIEGNVGEDYQPKIRNSFAALENLKHDSRDISSAWEHWRQQKVGSHSCEDNLNSQVHKYARESFHERLLLFLNTIYVMGEMPE